MIASVIFGRASFLTCLKMVRRVNICKNKSRALDANLERERGLYSGGICNMTEEMRRELAEMERRSARRLAKEEAEIKYRRANGKSDKTCAGCVRCKRVDFPETRDKDHSTGWHCCCRYYDAGILPSDPACKDWWDKEQYEREKQEEAERTEAERKRKWAIYADKPPVKLPIVFDGYGYIPECPVCHEMPYSTEQCHWCGQHFIQDEEVIEYSKPKTKKGKCFNCGAEIEIRISRYNGHKHFHCDKCGMSVME